METGVTGSDTPTTEEVSDSTEQVQERPEWLPEKFSTAEDLAKAYGELETKNSTQPKETVDDHGESDATTEKLTFESFSKYSQEFTDTGDISPESVEEIVSKYGLPEELVKEYVDDKKAVIKGMQKDFFESLGGEEEYASMMEWAGENLTKEDMDSYDKVMNSGDMAAATMAARGLSARKSQATGTNPRLLRGSAPTSQGGNPFKSWTQVSEAMRDPKYAKDAAFRAEIQSRLAISKL